MFYNLPAICIVLADIAFTVYFHYQSLLINVFLVLAKTNYPKSTLIKELFFSTYLSHLISSFIVRDSINEQISLLIIG